MNVRDVVTLALVGAAALAGCTARERTPIVVYSPHGKELLAEFERRYEAANPDNDVRWLDMGSQDVFDRVRTERDNPQADIWWGAPSATFELAEGESLLQRYVPTWDSAVAPEHRSPAGNWYGTMLVPQVIMYNTRMLSREEVPADWDRLLDERWRGAIVIRNPVASGTMRTVFASIIQREIERGGGVEAGLRWLERLEANTRTYAADPTQLYLKIAREEGSLTIWNLPDVLTQAGVYGYPFGYVVPASGTPVIVDGIAVVRGARHPAAALSFYEFVTSRESMALQAERFYRIPARRDIPADRVPPWMRGLRLTPLAVDRRAAAAHEREWMRLWEERVRGSARGG